jgi:phosphatidylinositol glycan class H protein
MLPLIARLISPPSQTLRTLKPTPSTVSFTVSTRPERKTVPATLKHWIGILIRILVGVAVLLLLWVKWRVSNVQSTDVLLRVLGGRQTVLMLQIVGRCQWRYLVPGAAAVLFTVLRRGYTGSPILIFCFMGPY